MKHSNFMVHVVDSDQAIADGLAALLGAAVTAIAWVILFRGGI